MNITLEKTGELTATIKIEIQESDYAENLEKELRNFRKQIQMPGFRPGKVPMGIIRKKYGLATKIEEINKVMSDALTRYIEEQKLELIGYPINSEKQDGTYDFEIDKDFTFNFDVAFKPDFEIDISENLEVEYPKIIVEEDVIDNYIKNLRK